MSPSLALCLATFGIATGATDTATNDQGTAVERGYGRPITSPLYAMCSIGILLGASAAAATLCLGIDSLSFFTGAAVVLAIVDLRSARTLLGESADDHTKALDRRRPRPCAAQNAQVTPAFDRRGHRFQRAVRRRGRQRSGRCAPPPDRNTSFGFAALASAAFGMAMAIRRLAGDTIIERAGRQRAPAASALVAATAMGAAVLVPVTGASVPAFAILGLMLANIVTSAFCWPAA